MPFILFDEFQQTLGGSHTNLESAKDAVRQLGENAGEIVVAETIIPLTDMADLSKHKEFLTGRYWKFDSRSEEFVLEREVEV